jgi:hypothetical protein
VQESATIQILLVIDYAHATSSRDGFRVSLEETAAAVDYSRPRAEIAGDPARE